MSKANAQVIDIIIKGGTVIEISSNAPEMIGRRVRVLDQDTQTVTEETATMKRGNLTIQVAVTEETIQAGEGAVLPVDAEGKREALISQAREQFADDDLQINDDAGIAPADGGNWVEAWVYVPCSEEQNP